MREVDRFKREKAEEMKCVVLDFILLEIEVNRAMERAWRELVPRLEGSGAWTEDAGKIDDATGSAGRSGGGTWATTSGQQMHASQKSSTTGAPSPINSHVAHHPGHIGLSAPIYSNVPSPATTASNITNVNSAGTNPTMEEGTAIQYRNGM